MAQLIDFSFPPEVEDVRLKVRQLMDDIVRPQWDEIDPHEKSLAQYVGQIIGKAEPNVPADCKPSASCNTTVTR